MTARKVRWAANRADGTPIILDGVIADVDEETGAVSINERTATAIREILAHEPQHVETVAVPVVDFAEEVHRLIVSKGTAPVALPQPQAHGMLPVAHDEPAG